MDKKSAPTSLYRDRRSFAKIPDVMDVPNLIAIQTESFDWFKNEGLAQAFADVCPIENNTGDMCVEFGKHEFGEPKYTVDECKEKDVTYQAPLFVEIRFINRETGEIKEQEVFMGDFPLMTPRGTFIINGTERVVVSQLVRSPGVYFASERDKTSDKTIYNAKVIPSRGAWLEFETDKRDLLSVRIDRKRKQPATLLVRALGLAETREEIIELLGSSEMVLRTLDRDPATTKEESLIELYKRFRPGEPPTIDSARTLLDGLFFNPQRYDLAKVGRYKMDKKLGFTPEENDSSTLTNEDIIRTMRYIIGLHNGDEGFVTDDIDHFGNRRIRSVGELIQNQFRIGLSRMERVVRERMSMQEPDEITPQSLVNIRPIVAAIKEFFGSSQLSQFMDQSNPAAGITHKRRLSALGPGGLSRERAGFEVRDVHTSHYGRMCPIETPEGPNIGLIGSLATYGRINPYGFIETPYRRVIDGKVTDEIDYLTADEEENFTIAQANDLFDLETREFGYTDEDGVFHKSARVLARTTDTNGVFGEAMDVPPEMVNYMDVSPRQMTSVATSLIPFLEHDDANRALMGSNMMRQAVPLVTSEAPIVGTGIEKDMISDSRIQIVAEGDGEVVFADATKIQIKYERTEDEVLASFEPEVTTYELPRYRRTNQNTSITLKPAVLTGDKVVKGQILTEGYSTQHGELALGRNLKVAFMPWKGYNFEDAIVISERIQREDIFTSVHVDEYIMEVRDTKRGVEELTSDIPNVSEDATKDLDANGIIRIGANVHPGDILIGKITPKGESDPSPEEKLLRAIFGDKAGDVKDASLKAQPSLHGVVIDTRLYSRANKEGKKGKSAEKAQLEKLDEKFAAEISELTKRLVAKLWTLLQGKATTGITDYFGVELYPAGTKFSQKLLEEIARKSTDEKTGVVMGYLNLGSCKWTGDAHTDALIEATINNYTIEWKKADAVIKREKYNITNGDELPQTGVIQMAKVYIAKKRKLKVGDKMAGRHGNKGIVARIVRDEDMPFLEDGTIVDICLNPLGVPSRMNLGQIYETVLGWAGRELGLKFATPIFDGASLDQINEYTAKAGIPHSGRTYLYDGGTGEKFDQPATVGVIYMLKLGHMIDDKMHARSIGPYSLITQQPLGGKAQFGGQRFGEMEVWALEGFGAANILQEILTIKSDDVMGRAKAYEAIVKGENLPRPGIPEAMNVLLHELRGLALSVKLE